MNISVFTAQHLFTYCKNMNPLFVFQFFIFL